MNQVQQPNATFIFLKSVFVVIVVIIAVIVIVDIPALGCLQLVQVGCVAGDSKEVFSP
jgi:hypothetical protein